MDTKTIEQVNVLKADALATVEGGKNDLTCILGTAGFAGVGFVFAGPAGAAFLGGVTAMRVC